jgi:hypothetical protein
MHLAAVPENARDLDIASVRVIDDDNDEYTCTLIATDIDEDQQPFVIIGDNLRTSLSMHDNSQ